MAKTARSSNPPIINMVTTISFYSRAGTFYEPALLPRRLVEMDGHFRTHAGKNSLAGGALERNYYRNALPNLGKIPAGRVLIGQERELTCRLLQDLCHLSAEGCSAICIKLNINRLSN